ncbi:Crp/Fnr family transcriptional regulator [Flammeovirgaceae bacterium 311]|nr:Crp/Fnr family transcriptional regulator [Flammeovirgaceae bacterium 311]
MTHKNTRLLYQKIIGLAGSIPEASLDKLFGLINYKQIAKGDYILNQGQICCNIVFVEKGLLRSFIVKEGIVINTGFTIENNFTTNLKSLRSSLPSDVSIQAGEDSAIYEFPRDALFSLYKESPEIESFGRKLLEQLLMEQEEHTNLFKIYTPAERYQFMQKNKPEITQRVSLTQLASYLGVARETLSRIRKLK